ncbi:thioredoxin domain-containing protein 3-like isoform X1 [Daphnia carinata]|uniref:thioredoxin domain-containing protein 3-like isoform X1 n=2 Tax=Daphnia carinata TaxID=120202 RepID=UPI00257FAF46|nr:thioredoxin domain-containing protein 3-like isoform X1 [Daphnia carinata]XP_059350602.1 thioredoxin domain-containing protein 3-like isoform X1 [Daphnia carinata]
MAGALLARKMAAGKKRVDHVAWQIEVATNEEWEELTKLQGLVVVDVYSEWCGPCTAMASHLKEIKLQLGDDLLHCALAKADCIGQLSKFRSRSEPTWLFLAGGEPVALIRGANAPLIRKTLLAELQTEKEVLEGTRQRVALSWDSFDLPNSNPETEETNQEDVELTTAPDNWLELDGLTLKGSYRLILDKLIEALTEKKLAIVARSAVSLNKKDCLILWFPSTVEDESLAEWFDHTIKSLIAEVEPKTVHEEGTEDELAENVEGLELEEKTEHTDDTPCSAEANAEESEYQPIEFHLIADPDEKEALIKQLEKESGEEEETAENETPAVEEVAEEEVEKQPEEEEPTENLEQIVEDELAKDVSESVE